MRSLLLTALALRDWHLCRLHTSCLALAKKYGSIVSVEGAIHRARSSFLGRAHARNARRGTRQASFDLAGEIIYLTNSVDDISTFVQSLGETGWLCSRRAG